MLNLLLSLKDMVTDHSLPSFSPEGSFSIDITTMRAHIPPDFCY